MPIDRSLYPPDWEAIALAKKDSTDWTCEHCGRPCRMPGESIDDFEQRLDGDLRYMAEGSPMRWIDDLYESVFSEEDGIEADIMKPQRFTLTVAHLDQNPQNNDPSNLKALCAPCHLKHDRPFHLYNRRRKRERQGQLNLLHPNVHPEPAGHGRNPKATQHPIGGLEK